MASLSASEAFLHEGDIDKRVQFMIEGLFAVRKAGFEGKKGVPQELDLVDEEDQIVHELSLDDELQAEATLDVFKVDPEYEENEKKYSEIKKEILGESSSDEEDDSDGSDESDEESDEEEAAHTVMQQQAIQDQTETNLVNLRRTIYLTIMSSLDFEEAGHKLMKIHLQPGQEVEICTMLTECCSQERTYLRYYGLLAQRFCFINNTYAQLFDEVFMKQYSTIHRLETNKLRNVSEIFCASSVDGCHVVDVSGLSSAHGGGDNVVISYLHQDFVPGALRGARSAQAQ